MFTLDIPYVPAQDAPIMLAQAATPAAASRTLQPDYLLNVCREVPSVGDLTTAMNGIDPIGRLALELGNRTNRDIYNNPTALGAIKIALLEGTTQGKLIPKTAGNGQVYYMYEPKPDYQGKDKAVFLAVFEGKRYKVVVNLKVQQYIDERTPLCPKPQLINLKSKPVSGSDYDLNSITVSLAALDGGALGQTTSERQGATITLGTNAAGYNWFIDNTPADNSEFLPTSNPNEWVAKAGRGDNLG